MNVEIDVGISDDYAILRFKGGSFYYGYETTKCRTCGEIGGSSCSNEDHSGDGGEWCFVVGDRKDNETVYPASMLGGNEYDVVEKLLYGIAEYMSRK